MTYCLAIKVQAGLVLASDTRTNAGMDHISTYSKMYAFDMPGERCFVLLSAGNLATTQAVTDQIQRDLDERATPSLYTVTRAFEAAEYVGSIGRRVQERFASGAQASGANLETTFILGAQIGGQPHELLLIYPEGNYIYAPPSRPYLQIGEAKYGKPILDRVVRPETTLGDAARCALVSLDSTMRSNVSVGAPFELAIYERGSLTLGHRQSFDLDDPFYVSVQQIWNKVLLEGIGALPLFDWERAEAAGDG